MYKEILLTLDGSALSEAAIPHAIAVAKAFGARVTLLSVVEPIGVYAQPGAIGPVLDVTLNVEEEKENIRQYLGEIAVRFEDQGIGVRRVVRDGDAASQICDYSEQNDIDLIVMSTHGRSGIMRWVYGSVADRVLRAARAAVLLVRVRSAEEK